MTITIVEVRESFPELECEPEPLGEGSFKIAFQCASDGSPLVLKIVKQALSEAEGVDEAEVPERVRRELVAMQAIHSDRVVRLLEGPDFRSIGDGTRLWYLEPLYPGGSLKERLQQPLATALTLQLCSDLLEGVSDIDEARLVHRDIKPANVVFDQEDRAVLLDLGIAYHLDLTDYTEPHLQSPKTAAYAAPEQFEERRAAIIDTRTDLFQVGVVTFHALTGKHPFNLEDPAGYMERLMNGRVDEGALADAVAPEAFKKLLLRLLRPRPNQRFRTVLAAQEELRGIA